MSRKPLIKTAAQIDHVRQAGQYLNELLILIALAAQPGVTGLELEAKAQAFLDAHDLIGSFKGYEGFPTNLCLSINECVVHGLPDKTVLKKGDLLKIDAGVTYKGGIADSAVSIIVGGKKHNRQGSLLIDATKKALDQGIKQVLPGVACIAYARTVHKTLLQHNCAVIKTLTGHGVGEEVHEPPHLYNRPHESMASLVRTPGRVVALEPITAVRSTDFKHKPHNERNLYTSKGDLGAQREYTLAIHDNHIEILAGIEDESVLYKNKL